MTQDQTNLQESQISEIKGVTLEPTEIANIDKTFSEAKDFRQIGEKIVSPIDDIVDKTSHIIENDPIMDVSGELATINTQVHSVYKEIIDDDGAVMKFMKSIPGIGGLAEKFDNKKDELSFNLKTVRGKIESIFSGFDISYTSLNKSIDMQKEFLTGLEQNMSQVEGYKEYIRVKLEEFNQKILTISDENELTKYKMFIQQVEYFLTNLNVLTGNLELARKRLLMRLDAAVKLSLSMNGSRPIFQTLLSVAIMETSGQKALDASAKAMQSMGSTIDNMSKDLTDKTIESSRKVEEMTSKPVLDNQVFIDNVKKLKDHFETIDQYRQTVKQQAEQERIAFEQANEDLKKIKEIKVADYDELASNLTK